MDAYATCNVLTIKKCELEFNIHIVNSHKKSFCGIGSQIKKLVTAET